MKKNRGGKENVKSRRLALNRETIQILNDPALLELVQGQMYEQAGITTMTQTRTGYEVDGGGGGGC